MKKAILIVMIVLLTFTIIALGSGCKAQTTETTVAEATDAETTAAAGEKITIAVIPNISAHPWWIRAEWGVEEAQKDLGFELIYVQMEVADATKQVDAMNDMINKGVDAIIASAIDSAVMVQPVNDAIAKGIPVIAYDVGLPGSNFTWWVTGLEAELSGRTIGEGIAKEIGGKGKVGLMLAWAGAELMEKRMDAAKEALAKYPDIELVGEYASESDQEKALTIWESVIQANPDIKGMGGLGTDCIAAACNAVSNAGLCGQIALWGVGLPLQNAEFIKNGCAKGIFLMDPGEMGYMAAVTAYNFAAKNELPKPGDEYRLGGKADIFPELKSTFGKDFVFTPENVDDFQF